MLSSEGFRGKREWQLVSLCPPRADYFGEGRIVALLPTVGALYSRPAAVCRSQLGPTVQGGFA